MGQNLQILRIQAQFVVAFSKRDWRKRVLMTAHICVCVGYFSEPLLGLLSAMIILTQEALDYVVRSTFPERDEDVTALRIIVILAIFGVLSFVYALPGILLIQESSKIAVVIGLLWMSGVAIHNLVTFAQVHILSWLTTLPVGLCMGYALVTMRSGAFHAPQTWDNALLFVSFVLWAGNMATLTFAQRENRKAFGSARLKTEEQLKKLDYLAKHDALTGVLNRRAFDELLDDALIMANEENPISIAVIDLNGFKPINDTFGHAAGDAVLVEIARRLTARMGMDRVARLGGDEFVVILPFRECEIAMQEAEELRALFVAPIDYEGQQITVGAAFGIATSVGGEEVEAMCKRADAAMYKQKPSQKRQSARLDHVA